MEMKDIFSNVNDQLKFAEAKNAALIAYNGLITFGVIRLLNPSNNPIEGFQAFCLLLFLALCTFSLSRALLSFFPKLSNLLPAPKQSSSNNIIFFGDLKDMTAHRFLNLYFEDQIKNEDRKAEWTRIEADLANQIIINSGIAFRKFTAFQTASLVSLIATIFGALIILSIIL
ncbi:Pycsar system effector family protein [Neptuniibacter sp. QD72_48]|uniref:Pycsar system effector family protein n=1 Tax=Neptuniibacter sp. QD72_48 TaxID=3398214 RepID=UPI0039F4D735